MDHADELSPVLSAEGLRRTLGGRTIIDVDAFAVDAGETVAILGPNGAGKSTLFRLLLLLERPDAGTIRYRGRPVTRADRPAGMAGVFQHPHLFAGTVRANVSLAARFTGAGAADRTERVDGALALLGLTMLAGRDVRTLSGGEARRVAVARAFATLPAVLLLDEPTANLDVNVKRAFRADLERATRGRGCAVVVVTHDPADAFALADRIAVMEAGRIVQMGTPEDLVLRPATPFVAAFTGADLLLDGTVEAVEDGLVLLRTPGGARVHGLAMDTPAAGDPAHASYRPEDVTLVAGSPRTSAVNRYAVTVRSLTTTGPMVRVGLDGPLELVALVTRQSVEALELAPGRTLEAHLKATAVRIYPAG